jgi:hypothetical protein
VLNPTKFDTDIIQLGKRFQSSSAILEKDISLDQTLMDIHTFIPANGFHPVSLVVRGENVLENAYRKNNR